MRLGAWDDWPVAVGAGGIRRDVHEFAVGGVLQAAGVTDATNADDIITQFNALLASLRTSGVLQDNT